MIANDRTEIQLPGPPAQPLSARFARNISTRRRMLDLTQAQLAQRLGVDKETLSRFERGKHLPSLATLERLASILMTTIAELLDETPQLPDDDAIAITSWLSRLNPEDKEFVLSQLKQFCEHLAVRSSNK